MKEITLQEVQAQQKAAEKLRKRNGNRVQLWYNHETGQFTICELTGNDYMVATTEAEHLLPSTYDYYNCETQAQREADLERRTMAAIEQINALNN